MSAMLPFNLEKGMTASSWKAEFALRIRVRKSAIGSVMVMAVRVAFLAWFPTPQRGTGPVTTCGRPQRAAAGSDGYQLDLVTPGSSPAWAISRRQIRHRPNLRYTECGRPQRLQRV